MGSSKEVHISETELHSYAFLNKRKMQHSCFLFKTLGQVQRTTPKWVELPGISLPSKSVSPSKHFP